MNSVAILSHDSFLLNFSVSVDDQRIGNNRRPVFELARKNHIAPVTCPVLPVLRIVQQLADDALPLVFGRIEQKSRDVLGRRNIADDVEPHSAEVRGVVHSRREFVSVLKNFLSQQPIDFVSCILDIRLGGRITGQSASSR